MYVNVVFVIKCLYSAVSLTLVNWMTGAWSEKERWPLEFILKDGILNTRVSGIQNDYSS